VELGLRGKRVLVTGASGPEEVAGELGDLARMGLEVAAELATLQAACY
jgi:hypothetical protein